MDYSIRWTRRASLDIDSIFRFYKERASLSVASRRLESIKRDISCLCLMPYAGPMDDEYPHTPSYRYLTVLDYRIYYFVEESNIYIAAIWDCRQGGKVF